MSGKNKYDRVAFRDAPSPIENELKKVFNPNDPLTIFDIGSCEGEDSIRYAKLFPNASVYAFEPLPKNLDRIEACLKEHPDLNIQAIPYALSRQSGKGIFYVSSGAPPGKQTKNWDFGNKSSSLLPPAKTKEVRPWLKFQEEIEVEKKTILEFCKERGIQNIDVIHMDVQGAEIDVMEGAGNLLNTTRLIWLEVSSVELYQGQPLKNDIENYMQDRQFKKMKDTVKKASGDQLYINSRFTEAIHRKSVFLQLFSWLK